MEQLRQSLQLSEPASQLLVAFVLGGVAMLLTERFVRGFRIQGGILTAMVAGIVYGVLHAVLQKALLLITLPFVILSLGLFVFVVNAFLLWLTSKLVPRVRFASFGSLIAAAFVLALIDILFHWVLRQGPLF